MKSLKKKIEVAQTTGRDEAQMFAERLRTLRKSKGLTQLELAKLLGVSTSTIGMYEQGRREPELSFVMKIASYFQVSSDFILGFDKNKEEEKTIENVLDEIKMCIRDRMLRSSGRV